LQEFETLYIGGAEAAVVCRSAPAQGGTDRILHDCDSDRNV